jgi:hypothetical protein
LQLPARRRGHGSDSEVLDRVDELEAKVMALQVV